MYNLLCSTQTVLPSSLIYVSAPVLYIYSNEVYTVYAHFHETLHCSVHFFFIMYVGMLYYCHIYIKTQFFRNSYVSLHKKKRLFQIFVKWNYSSLMHLQSWCTCTIRLLYVYPRLVTPTFTLFPQANTLEPMLSMYWSWKAQNWATEVFH